MHHSLSIAVVGAGTAGLAAAALLKRDGHQVSLYEKFESARPVGAGLLLQPTGLACLAHLGLEETIIKLGARVNSLYGETQSGKLIFDVAYSELQSNYFGVGIHRASLFQTLYEEAIRQGVEIHTNTQIVNTELSLDKRELFDANGQLQRAFDLVLDASGRNSALRPKYLERHNRLYPYGAIWGLLQDPKQEFSQDKLQQRYHKASIMAGILPIGKAPDKDAEQCTFFWSLPSGGYDKWLQEDINEWKNKVQSYWPQLTDLLTQFDTHEQLIHAQYSDIILRQWHEERLVFLGDAGHNSSPQLGQGANLALCDATVLATVIRQYQNVQEALELYTQLRKSHIRFYQFASRWLTPFFQSDSKLYPILRDYSFAAMAKNPWLRQQMLKTLGGVKTGVLGQLDPGLWHEKYRLQK